MINSEDARIQFINARIQELWAIPRTIQEYHRQEEKIRKIENTLKLMSPDNKPLISQLNEEYSLLIAYIVDIFYSAGLKDGMRMPEYMAEACQKLMRLQVVSE